MAHARLKKKLPPPPVAVQYITLLLALYCLGGGPHGKELLQLAMTPLTAIFP